MQTLAFFQAFRKQTPVDVLIQQAEYVAWNVKCDNRASLWNLS